LDGHSNTSLILQKGIDGVGRKILIAKRKVLNGKHIQKTGFKGIQPTPGEAQNTVTMAKYLKRLVQY